MKRWNGWGNEAVTSKLAPGALAMLEELVGSGNPLEDCSLETVLKTVPPSRLPKHPLISSDAMDRLAHARGQSLPDWVALRFGKIKTYPDGVAFPKTSEELRQVLKAAREFEARVIPYGGGTSVVGHLTPPEGSQPVLTISLAHLNQLISFNPQSQLATFGAGVAGPDLEAALRSSGYTLGHYPQSFEYSTLGGWVVTRSSGQQSMGYGRIEDMFAGGRVLTPAGDLTLPPLPASAAGPDLRQLVLGSEGRMGILDEVVIRVRELPVAERFHAVFFPNWEMAECAVRIISQSGLQLSMMRLSNAVETQTNLTLAGKEKLVGYLKQFLKLRKVNDQGCMLLLGFTGSKAQVRFNRSKALDICRASRGVHVFKPLGKAWNKNRFKAPYLRNTLWDMGYAVDTLETCVTWDKTAKTVEGLEAALSAALTPFGEKIHVFSHLSHFYTSGCSIYTTYLFRLSSNHEDTLKHWRALKAAAGEVIVANGGTISHQHGVGEDHRPWLIHEKSPLGLQTISRVWEHFDSDHIMNPGKLVD